MPEIVVHHAMGDKVLQRIGTEISSLIDYDIFRFAVMGPDPYLFYRFCFPMFRHGVHRRSRIMHTSKMGSFLMELADRSQSREVFSFLAGFLCHYALDSTTHPFICKEAENQSSMHTAIEHKLDVLELERQGKQCKDIMRLLVKCPDLPEVHDAMQRVYGWRDHYYAIGARYMNLYYWIAKDQHGVLNFFFHGALEKWSTLSYRTGKADDLDLTIFPELQCKAIERGAELITVAYEYRNKRICKDELRSIIGDDPYV